MKITRILTAALAAASITACLPDNRQSLDERIVDLKIIVTPGEVENTYVLESSRKDIIGFWDLGNGITVNGANSVVAEYPFAGNYTISLQGYSNGGITNSAKMVLPVLNSNFELLKDSVYTYICGELGNDNGKTWVVDSLLYGHLTIMNINNPDAAPNNTAINVDAKAKPGLRGGELRMGRTMYDDEATFILSPERGPAFVYENNKSSLVTNTGSNVFKNQVFMKAASWKPGNAVQCNTLALPAGFVDGYNGDWKVDCTPPDNMKWLLDKKTDGSYNIMFPNVTDGPGGFLFFALDWASPYKILSLTEDRMVVEKQTMSGNGLATRSLRRLVMIRKGSQSGLPLESVPEAGSIIK